MTDHVITGCEIGWNLRGHGISLHCVSEASDKKGKRHCFRYALIVVIIHVPLAYWPFLSIKNHSAFVGSYWSQVVLPQEAI